MARKPDSKSRQNAARVAQWLVDHRSEFEQEGVSADSLGSAVGLSSDEVTAAVDTLENRDEVVRMPQASTTSSRFVLKPGRAWPDVRAAVLDKKGAAG
jgi:hypothetical protein